MFVVIWAYATMMAGPLSALLGSIGAWLLVVQRKHGAHPGLILLTGVGIGVVFGVVGLLMAVALARLLFAGRQGIDGAGLMSLLSYPNLYLLIAGATGATVGLLTAAVVSRTHSR